MTVTGSCHCGKIAYELDEDPPTAAMACNCSICRRNCKTGHEIQSRKIDVWRFRDGKAVGFLKMYDTLGFARVAGLL